MKKNLTEQYKIKLKNMPIPLLEETFRNACSNGMLTAIKFMLSSPDIKKFNINAMHEEDQASGLAYAALHGQIEVVKYLYTSKELPEPLMINNSVRMAALYNQFPILEYLLFKLQEEDINTKMNEETKGFRAAIFNGHHHIVDYFIFDYELNENIIKEVASKFQNEQKWILQKLQKRELNKSLVNKLPDISSHNKKSKI